VANWPRKAHESLNLRGSIKSVRISRTIKIKKVVARDGGLSSFCDPGCDNWGFSQALVMFYVPSTPKILW